MYGIPTKIPKGKIHNLDTFFHMMEAGRGSTGEADPGRSNLCFRQIFFIIFILRKGHLSEFDGAAILTFFSRWIIWGVRKMWSFEVYPQK